MTAKNPGSDGLRKEIELRAYYIWEREGRPQGRQHEHWAVAEAEILSEQRTAEATPPKKATAKKAAPTKNPADKKPNGSAKAAKPDVPVKAAAKVVKKKAAKPKKSASPDR
jgi:hypothetical protein